MRSSFRRRSLFAAQFQSRGGLIRGIPVFVAEPLEARRLLSGTLTVPAGATERVADLPLAAQQVIGAAFTQEAALTGAAGAVDDHAGWSVAISGTTVVVGAPQGQSGGNSTGPGEAYVFNMPAAGWGNMTQTAKLTASDGVAGDIFGGAVAISGNTVVVGAPEAKVGDDELGAAYVFTEPADGWAGNLTQTAKLTVSAGMVANQFGRSVAISGNTVVVGQYVYSEPPSGWANMTQTAQLVASDGLGGNDYGSAAAISGSTVVVGAWTGNVAGNSQQGAVYLFAEPATGWAGNLTQTAKLTAADGAVDDQFGAAVAISGNTVVAGSVDADQKLGAAYVFTAAAGGWAGNLTQTAKLTATKSAAMDSFGYTVGISGNTVVVGQWITGSAYTFIEPGNGWTNMTQTSELTPAGFGDSGSFGYAVAVSGSTLVVGALAATVGANANQGMGYVFANPVAATPGFSNLSPSSSIAQGTSVTFSGKIAGGGLIPPSAEAVAVTLNGMTQIAAINSQGIFTTTFNTSLVPAANTPYQVTYAYAGDINFSPAANTTTTQLTVTPAPASIAGTIYADTDDSGVWNSSDPALAEVMVYLDANNNGKLDAGETSVTTDANGNYRFGNLAAGNYTVCAAAPGGYVQTAPALGYISVSVIAGQAVTGQTFLAAPVAGGTAQAVYRLYSPVTLEHLYTTDPNEYNTLASYVGTWNGEGEVFNEYSGSATLNGVTDAPLYRLYDAGDKQHFWTDNYNEYNTLRNAPWNWNDEGIAGYVFPSAVPSSAPLYRMMAPQVHLWTTDLNEYDTLANDGWTQEGIIGYVLDLPQLAFGDDFHQAAGSLPGSANWAAFNATDPNNASVIYTNNANPANGPVTLQVVNDASASNDKALAMTLAPAEQNGQTVFDSAEIATLANPLANDLEYGTIAARIKLPGGAGMQGIWPAFWMLGNDIQSSDNPTSPATQVPWPECGEIDIMENKGGTPGQVQGSLHAGASLGQTNYDPTGYDNLPAGEDFYTSYHTFAVTWTSTTISFSVDGNVYETQPLSNLPAADAGIFNKPFFIILDVCAGGSFAGPSTPTAPQTMYVDWVRAYTGSVAAASSATVPAKANSARPDPAPPLAAMPAAAWAGSPALLADAMESETVLTDPEILE